MKPKALPIVILFLLVSASPFLTQTSAESVSEIEIIQTAVNPSNNHTYHLLSASSWTDAAVVARSLDGFLVTVDDAEEDAWLFETFASDDNSTRHLWIGLSDQNDEGDFRWHDGTPFTYRNWGENQPGTGNDEDYVHITGTNMGNIEPATWNDLENDPQYFPVYGVVEVGEGADFALRFDGDDDHVIIDEELPEWTDYIEIEAWVNVPDYDGIQFITMYGDYGWGLYLNDGYLGYSNEYSISKNPKSDLQIQENVWTHIKVVVDTEIGGEFFIDNQSVGVFGVNKSQIPVGDFGSNDCYQSGEDCDELFIGRMGAGCDCNYFNGMIDDVRISDSTHSTTWEFPEGEGSVTMDENERHGDIIGAAWVMPDGSIVAQAIELENDVFIEGLDAQAGDTLLFFFELPENVEYISLSIFSYGDFDDWEFDPNQMFDAYISKDEIPTAWDHDYMFEAYYGPFVSEYFEYPEDGVYWITLTAIEDVTDIEVYVYWELAPEPPSLDDMIELNDGISVTGQTIRRNSGDSLYFYVDLVEELSEISVKTWGGEGNCDLHIAYEALPTSDFWIGDFDEGFSGGRDIGSKAKSDHSYNNRNGEDVQIYDAQPGLYYIMMTSWGGCREVTILAEFTYPPKNIEPDAAIELFSGIEYGPLSGFEGLDQYFFINVPIGTERLEVDLNNGEGEARLMLRHEQIPTWTTYDKHSNSPGAGDKIGFNDPTPGKWYILLGSEEYYSRIDITASFEDRYVWKYDGEPLQLYNNEEISGISASKGDELSFFIDLSDEISEEVIIKTWGAEGDLSLEIDAESFGFSFEPEDDFGRQWGGEMSFEVDDGLADEVAELYFVTGRIDITMIAITDLEDISIVGSWSSFDTPNPPIDPPEPRPEPEEFVSCIESAGMLFEEFDMNSDGDLTYEEISSEVPIADFEDVDYNKDGVVDKIELKQVMCECENEIYLATSQVIPNDRFDGYKMDDLAEFPWINNVDLFSIDNNNDEIIDYDEIDRYADSCKTTYDAFDRDGDGVPDDKDDFPDDPSEDTDSDGDGIGDNSDLIASINNDVIWISSGVIGFILVSVLGALIFKSRTSRDVKWTQNNESISDRMMFGPQNQESKPIVPPAIDLGPIETEIPEDMVVSDLFD